MDEQLKHCCGEAGIGSKSRGRLVGVGIGTISQLLQFDENELKNLCSNNCDDVLESLCLIAQWVRQNPNTDVLNEFDDDVFNKFKQDIRKKQEERKEWVNVYITEVLGKPYQKKNESLWKDVNSKPDLLEEVIRQCKKVIMAPDFLQKQIGKTFNHDSYLDMSTRHLHNLVPLKDCKSEKIIVISGRTQAGKSAVKGIIQSQCQLLKIAMIVLTKGVDESIELGTKLRAQGKYVVVASRNNYEKMSYHLKEVKIKEAFSHGGVLVIADTQSQILNKACKLMNQYREEVKGAQFILAVDEADAMFRTIDKEQAFEKAFLKLRSLKPLMTIMISATPISFMIDLVFEHEEAAENIEYYHLEPSNDYVGINDMRALMKDGREVFLEQNEINLKSEFESIPWANEKVIALYENAISCNSDGCKGILLLDCSSNRVYAKGNAGEKAIAVQNFIKKKWEEDIIVITITGSGKWVRFPGEEWEKLRWKKSRIGCILEYIDSHSEYGLGMPVFIFGYTKMCRGVSFRSRMRVPTHMLMSLGRGHNCSTVVQTLGRATFNGKSLLKENGFDHVTILLIKNDFDVCTTKQNFIDIVSSRVRDGDPFVEAFTGAKKKLPHYANFLFSSPREIGKLKGQRTKYKDSFNFKDPPMELDAREEKIKELFWDDDDVQQAFRSLCRLSSIKTYKGGELRVEIDCIAEDLWQMEMQRVTKKKIKDSMKKLCENALVFKEEGDAYSIRHSGRLKNFLNSKKEPHKTVSEDKHQIVTSSESGGESSPHEENNELKSTSISARKSAPSRQSSIDDTLALAGGEDSTRNKETIREQNLKEPNLVASKKTLRENERNFNTNTAMKPKRKACKRSLSLRVEGMNQKLNSLTPDAESDLEIKDNEKQETLSFYSETDGNKKEMSSLPKKKILKKDTCLAKAEMNSVKHVEKGCKRRIPKKKEKPRKKRNVDCEAHFEICRGGEIASLASSNSVERSQKLSAREERVRNFFWDNDEVQQLLRSLCRLLKKSASKGGNFCAQVGDVINDLGEEEGVDKSKGDVELVFHKLCDNALAEKGGEGYLVSSPTRLVEFINEKMGGI